MIIQFLHYDMFRPSSGSTYAVTLNCLYYSLSVGEGHVFVYDIGF
jgi:hypothetical protein